MNRNRRFLALIILIVGFLLFALIGVLFLRSQDQPQQANNNTPPPVVDGTVVAVPVPQATSELVEVVISLQTVPRGFQLTGAELQTELRLASEVAPNVVFSIDDAIGKYARNDIFQGETLTRDSLASDITEVGQEEFGPSSLIPFGTVAMAVPMDRLSSVAYALDEGDAVDIMLSFAFAEMDPQFRTLLRNSLTFYLGVAQDDGSIQRTVFVIDPYGRFETLPTGDVVHVAPSEEPRPLPVSILLQNARIVQVGPWVPPEPPSPPTPTPDPNAPTATPGGPPPTPTPRPPDVLLLSLPPQQQLFLKYALENGADIDFALRAAGDGQLNDVTNVDLDYLLNRFNIEIPPDIDFTIDPEGFVPSADEPPAAEGAPGDGDATGENE